MHPPALLQLQLQATCHFLPHWLLLQLCHSAWDVEHDPGLVLHLLVHWLVRSKVWPCLSEHAWCWYQQGQG
jgi:hypothetical protein